MSSPLLNPEQPKRQVVEWSRLIPGEPPGLRDWRKKVGQSARSRGPQRISAIAAEPEESHLRTTLTRLMPGPMHSRMATRWFRSMTADFALVALNWLLIGAVLVPLRIIFPNVRSFNYAEGAPLS